MSRSVYDRFVGEADTKDWHPEAFHQGSEARTMDAPMLKSNPFDRGTWMWKSFNAGWADCDQLLRSERETGGQA